MKKLILGAAFAVTAITLSAGAASASTPHLRTAFQGPTFLASTTLTGRPDSGGNGTWAVDSMTRHLSITETGESDGVFTFTATVSDAGASFAAISGAFTPNQGAPYTGDLINGTPSGPFSGSASYSFTATSLPTQAHNLGMPASESGAPGDLAQTTSGWYEQAFPDGTVFGGTGITTWGWTYATSAHPSQQWADTSADDAGQLPGDGNISS